MTKQIQTNPSLCSKAGILIPLFSILFLAIIGYPTLALEKPVELKYKLKVGDVLTYKTQMGMTAKISTTMGAQEGYTESEMNTTLTVTQIDDDGVITGAVIANTQIKKSLMDGRDMTQSLNDLMKQSGMEYQLEILKMRSNGSDLLILPQDAENNLPGWIALPEKPIKPGDSWTQELSLLTPNPESDQGLDLLTTTLVGIERVGEYNSAKIELTTPEQATDIQKENEGKLTVFFALNEGFPVKVEGTIKNKAASGLELEIQLNSELTKLSKLDSQKLSQARSELSIIETALEETDLLSQSDEEKKTALEIFLSDYPESQWRKGVEGLIARFSAESEDVPMIDEQAEDISSDIDEHLSSLGITKSDGQMADDFTLETIEGKQVSLSDYKGKIVFLNFWATWCPPCRSEMPSMEKLYQKFKDKDFIMLAVNLQEKSEQVSKFMKDNKLNFPALIDKGEVGSKYSVSSIPTTFFVDKHGRMIGHAVGSRDWGSEETFKLIEVLLETK